MTDAQELCEVAFTGVMTWNNELGLLPFLLIHSESTGTIARKPDGVGLLNFQVWFCRKGEWEGGWCRQSRPAPYQPLVRVIRKTVSSKFAPV